MLDRTRRAAQNSPRRFIPTTDSGGIAGSDTNQCTLVYNTRAFSHPQATDLDRVSYEEGNLVAWVPNYPEIDSLRVNRYKQ